MKPKTKEELTKELETLKKKLEGTEKKLQTFQKQNEALLASEGLTRAILDRSAEVIFVCDENGRIIRASHIAHRFFASKVLQRSFNDVCPLMLVSPLPFQSNKFSISSVLTGKIFQALQVIHERNDGQVFHFLLNGRPLIHQQQKVLGCVIILTDITERKQMELELAQLASFPQLNPDPVVEVDPAGQVHYSNPAAERLFPDLKKVGLHHPWLLGLDKIDETLKMEARRTYVRELRVGDRWYQQTVHYPAGGTRLRIYSSDITERKQAEEAAKASEKRAYDQAARLQTVLDAAPAIIWIAGDRECREITGNRAAYVFLRVPEGTDMSKSGPAPERLTHYRVFKDGVELTAREMPIQRVAASGQGLSDYAMELVFNDGTVRSVLGNINPVLDSQGQPNGAVAAFMDITERKKIAEELRRSRDELEIRVQERTKEVREQSRILDFFFKFSITPFVILDKNFNFIRVNEAYAKACQRDVSEFPGHNHFEFYPSDAKAKFEEVVQTKAPYVAIARPFRFPDHPEWGLTYWDWILTPIIDDLGEVEYLVFSLEDVTERKQAEEALRAAHQYTRTLIEASLDPLVTIDPDGKVTDVNTATELATGVSREHLVGSDFSDYFTEPEKAREGYQTAFLEGTVRDYPLAIRHRSGMVTDVLYNATIYKNEEGEVQGVFAAARDITERKGVEEALKESEARLRVLSSQLLSAQESERKRIALELHDGVGQMLTAIKFKIENTLQEKGKSGTQGKEESFEAVIPLVKETIEEVRRMQMDLHPSTLDDLGVLATLEWFCREYQKIYSHIRVEKEIAIQEDEVSTPLKVVLYRLTQEALNNVAKHSQADLARLSLRKQEAQIEWVIEDNGTGFDLENILFSEGSQRRLGLSSMRERIELSGGKFMIESTQGKGTTVRASWPL